MSVAPSITALPAFDFDHNRPCSAPSGMPSGLRDSDSSTTSSIYSNDSSDRSTTTSKSSKRVRFEEYASWSYFDANASMPTTIRRNDSGSSLDAISRSAMPIARPPLGSRSSSSISPREGWQRFKRQSSSSELDGMWSRLRRRDYSTDSADSLPSAAARSELGTIRQPLRESSGRRFCRAKTPYDPAVSGVWKTSAPPVVKGDWDDLLSGR